MSDFRDFDHADTPLSLFAFAAAKQTLGRPARQTGSSGETGLLDPALFFFFSPKKDNPFLFTASTGKGRTWSKSKPSPH